MFLFNNFVYNYYNNNSKTMKKVEYKDLIYGEIYFLSSPNWENDYIERYNKDKYNNCIRINKKLTSGCWVYHFFFSWCSYAVGSAYLATQEQKQWYEVCEKANKFISKEEVLKDFSKVPEYVEIVEQSNPHNWYKIGEKYRVYGLNKDKTGYYNKDGSTITWITVNDCKQITKEAYEAQNKPKSLVGRYLKVLSDRAFSIPCKKDDYLLITGPNNCKINANYWACNPDDVSCVELMPEGFKLENVEPYLPKKQEEFKVGDWVVFDVEKAKRTDNYTDCWNKSYVLQISTIDDNSLTFSREEMKRVGYTAITPSCSNNRDFFRKAESHEIPKVKVDKEGLLEEAKRRYPIGTKFKLPHLTGKYCTVKSHDLYDLTFSNRSTGNIAKELAINLLIKENEDCLGGMVYLDGKWAEIISIPNHEEEAINLALNSNFNSNEFDKLPDYSNLGKMLDSLEPIEGFKNDEYSWPLFYGTRGNSNDLLQEPVILSKKSKKSKLIIVNQ